jgi:Viral alkaline exonuclease
MVVCSSALHWILSPEPKDCSILPVSLVEDLLMSEGYLGSSSPMDWLRVVLAVTREQITVTAEKTKGQRNNALWCAVRKYRFTASNFCEIIRAANKNRSVCR